MVLSGPYECPTFLSLGSTPTDPSPSPCSCSHHSGSQVWSGCAPSPGASSKSAKIKGPACRWRMSAGCANYLFITPLRVACKKANLLSSPPKVLSRHRPPARGEMWWDCHCLNLPLTAPHLPCSSTCDLGLLAIKYLLPTETSVRRVRWENKQGKGGRWEYGWARHQRKKASVCARADSTLATRLSAPDGCESQAHPIALLPCAPACLSHPSPL